VGAARDLLTDYQHVIEDITLTTGGDSVFDVRVDGELVFSKHELGRLAEDGEVLGIFRDIVGPEVPVFGE
jgi:selenoprotein W-related protein